MNNDIAEILKGHLTGLPFIDRIGGLVKAVTFIDGPDEKPSKRVIPVDCGVTVNDCLTGRYKPLLPDSQYKSVSFFEDGGVRSVGQDSVGFRFQSTLRLVCWLNLKKLGKEGCSYSALAIVSILNAIPQNVTNSSPYTRLHFHIEGEEPKTVGIFSKYTFDEEKTQFLLYPYDYFALNITVSYVIPKRCLSALTADNELDCIDNQNT